MKGTEAATVRNMKKKFLLFCLFLIAFSGRVFAQEADPIAQSTFYRNSVYVELLGNGILPTLNYERLIWVPATKTTFALRAGGIFIPTGIVGGRLEYEMVAVTEITAFTGEKSVKFETGFGLTLYSNSYVYSGFNEPYYAHKYYELIPVVRIGARWQPENKPYLIRLGFTPLFFGEDNFFPPVMPFGGLSFGYRFGKR